MSALALVTAPAVEPVTLAEARSHLRAGTATDEDWEIQGWIIAARQRAESITRRRLVTQTWDWLLDCFPEAEGGSAAYARAPLEVPFGRLQSVTSITYVDSAGASQTLATTEYQVDAKSDPGRIAPAYLKSWPATREQMNTVTIRFVCGYGLAAAVPFAVKAAMLLMIGHLHEHREEVSDFQKFEVPNAAEALLFPYRILRF